MSIKYIPKSEKPYIGVFLSSGLDGALNEACNRMQMTKSEFVRYCMMKTLQELSLIKRQVKRDEAV